MTSLLVQRALLIYVWIVINVAGRYIHLQSAARLNALKGQRPVASSEVAVLDLANAAEGMRSNICNFKAHTKDLKRSCTAIQKEIQDLSLSEKQRSSMMVSIVQLDVLYNCLVQSQ